MPKVSLVLFITIEDNKNAIGLVTPDQPLDVDITDRQKAALLGVVAEMLTAARNTDALPGQDLGDANFFQASAEA